MESLAKFLTLPEAERTADQAITEAEDPFAGTASMKEFAEKILASKEYRASLYRRILCDELPAQIESLLYYYAAGKPTERFEHSGKNGAPIITEVRRVVVPVSQSFDEDDEIPSTTRH